MATTLFLLDAAADDLSANVDKLLSLSRGASAVSKVVTTTASGTTIIWTDGAGGTNLRWFSNPLQAVTISGQITVNLRGLESGNSVNSGVDCQINKTPNDGSSSTLIATTAVGTEWTTSETAKSVNVTPGAGVAFVDGDRLAIIVRCRNVGTMGAGTATLFINGPTGGASGDSFITFTEAILEYGGAPFGGHPDGYSGQAQLQQLLAT